MRSTLPIRLELVGLQGLRLECRCRLQEATFHLVLTPGQAEALASRVGTKVQATAKVRYEQRGDMPEIVSGTLVEWSPLDTTMSIIEALRKMFGVAQSSRCR